MKHADCHFPIMHSFYALHAKNTQRVIFKIQTEIILICLDLQVNITMTGGLVLHWLRIENKTIIGEDGICEIWGFHSGEDDDVALLGLGGR
jgi:hypothetical protein